MTETYQAEARIIAHPARLIVREEDGTEWDVYVGDGSGRYAIQRKGQCAIFTRDRHKKGGTIYGQAVGKTFGVNCAEDYIVRAADSTGTLEWAEND